jgi:hypothetical protein
VEVPAHKDLLAVCAERECMMAEKTLLRECITHFAGGFKTVESLDLGVALAMACSWQKYVQQHSDNPSIFK